jgi:hypothetical protein
MTFRKLPKRFATLLMPLILSLLMTCVVSLISVLKTGGLQPELLTIWLKAWGLSWLVAFPVLLVVLPLVRRIVGLLVEA